MHLKVLLLVFVAQVYSEIYHNETKQQECEFPPRTEQDLTHVRRKRLATVAGLVCLEDYPYTVSVRVNDTHICGGAIVSKQWVLTAGQCFDGVDADAVTVRAGSVFRDYGGYVLAAVLIETHPGYKRTLGAEHNLALVKLNVPITIGPRTQLVRLPVKNLKVPTRTGQLVVTGYGAVSEPLRTGEQQELRRMMVRVVPKAPCRMLHGSSYRLQYDHVCLQSVMRGVTLCEGDMGDPAVHFSGLERAGTLQGIAVHGLSTPCAAGLPGVYTEVAFSRAWIDLVLSGNLAESDESTNDIDSSSGDKSS